METIVAITVVLVLSLFFFSSVLLRDKKPKTPPAAPGAWPLLGHLHLLAGGTKVPHRALGDLADKCGPIFTIRLGMQRTVVVSSSETIKECFTTHDAAFSSRPKFAAAKYLAYNYAMFVFSPYGSYWRDSQTVASSCSSTCSSPKWTLLSNISTGFAKRKKKVFFVELKELFDNLTHDIILRMVAGKRYDENERCEWQKALREFFERLGMSVVSDAFPFLERFDIGGHIDKMKKTAQKMDSV